MGSIRLTAVLFRLEVRVGYTVKNKMGKNGNGSGLTAGKKITKISAE